MLGRVSDSLDFEVDTGMRRLVARGAVRGKIVVVPNGISAERFAQQPVPSGEHFTLVFLGTLKPWHGLGLLVDLFDAFHRRHEESRLLVVGDGPEREAVALASRDRNDICRARGRMSRR